ncbi:hypothetical protein ADIS_0244 [Lunatimonas lonarensis]|uniref:Glycoside hydrolase family 5 domain-containing protein n=1 Tax=Lunatimonas lonarensis TaxID=1232681 RepID=R7ZYV7_9BACT|nr:cellulase family glycosylhydrolase [Lunatimonas lonarensis]EON79239.1 hypothetical protein ADIS_0244 [Lunatimonas lonarensis]
MQTLRILCLCSLLMASFEASYSQGKSLLEIQDTRFLMNGKPFPFTGISFFNAIYNEEFNQTSAGRREYLAKFNAYGVNVLRVWCQWDNARGFIDGGSGQTMYMPDGSLKRNHLLRLKEIVQDADETGTVILLVLFSRESWNENIRLDDQSSERAVGELTKELSPYRNVIFQIWNEFDYRAVPYAKLIKQIDPARIVTNSPGYSGFLGTLEENRVMDYLSPHTSREDDRNWEIAPMEIRYLLTKFQKPVVDDEPARRGTPKFGGPKNPTSPTDHVLRIYNVWKVGGYPVYHHDMFQTGYGTDPVPPNGIPLPGFSAYHDVVFEFLKNRDRYLSAIEASGIKL